MPGQNVDSLFIDGKISVITFATHDATFAIPLEQVRYIEKDVERNIKIDESSQFNHEVISFQNKAVPLYDFCTLTGSTSALENGHKLVEIFNLREQDHVHWMQALEESIKKSTAFTLSHDPDKCAFGAWYNKFKTDDQDMAELMRKFDEPHRKIHGLARTLLDLAESDQEQAMTLYRREYKNTFAQLRRLFETAREQVLASIRPIIVFVEQGNGRTTALRLDNIKDIQSYNRQDFSRDESTEGVLHKKTEDFRVEGYLRNGNKAPFILVNCQPLKPG
jgi:hypothetical protein